MSNHPINLSRDTGLLRPALGKSISAVQSPGRHQWKRGMCGKAGGGGGEGGGGEEWVEGMFNLLIQFLPMLVTLPLREGGQMEHAAQNTQTKSHFLSTSQPPLFASPCLSLALFSPSNPLLPSTLPHFSHFQPPSVEPDWRTDWLTDSLCPTTAPVKMEKRGAQHLPDRFCNLLTLCLRVVVFCFVLFCVFLRTLFREPDPHGKAEKWDPPSKQDLQN